jgi:sulfur-oxidizing protein SoxY
MQGAVLNRRRFLIVTGVFALGLAAPAHAGTWRRHAPIMDLLAGREPVMDGVRLELPSVSDTGASIPIGIEIDTAMQDQDHVRRVHVLAPGNPSPEVFSVDFSPMAGQARLGTRIRLNESQRVHALAEMGDGGVRMASAETRVTVSGCLTDADTYDSADLMQTRIRVPARVARGQAIEVLTLINHPMETGLRIGSDGQPVPRHIIESFHLDLDGQPLLSMRLHPSMSANPFLRIGLRPPQSGTLTMTWHDDQGRVVRDETLLRVD